jgi:hypothetical protein
MKHPSLYRLQQDTLGELDFDAAARREGKRTLWERHGAVLAQHYGLPEAALAPVLDEIPSWPLAVLRQVVTAVERARMN